MPVVRAGSTPRVAQAAVCEVDGVGEVQVAVEQATLGPEADPLLAGCAGKRGPLELAQFRG